MRWWNKNYPSQNHQLYQEPWGIDHWFVIAPFLPSELLLHTDGLFLLFFKLDGVKFFSNNDLSLAILGLVGVCIEFIAGVLVGENKGSWGVEEALEVCLGFRFWGVSRISLLVVEFSCRLQSGKYFWDKSMKQEKDSG